MKKMILHDDLKPVTLPDRHGSRISNRTAKKDDTSRVLGLWRVEQDSRRNIYIFFIKYYITIMSRDITIVSRDLYIRRRMIFALQVFVVVSLAVLIFFAWSSLQSITISGREITNLPTKCQRLEPNIILAHRIFVDVAKSVEMEKCRSLLVSSSLYDGVAFAESIKRLLEQKSANDTLYIIILNMVFVVNAARFIEGYFVVDIQTSGTVNLPNLNASSFSSNENVCSWTKNFDANVWIYMI